MEKRVFFVAHIRQWEKNIWLFCLGDSFLEDWYILDTFLDPFRSYFNNATPPPKTNMFAPEK